MAEAFILPVGARRPPDTGKQVVYGTAGFRENAEDEDSALGWVVCRMGMLAATRSMVKGGSAVGLMITASHNPMRDNGIKLVDPDGGMMDQSWEGIATQLANAADDDVAGQLTLLIGQNHSADAGDRSKGVVFLGRDTRHSSPRLAMLAVAGVEAMFAKIVDLGIVTTPQLHFMVRWVNVDENGTKSMDCVNLDIYYTTIANAFNSLNQLIKEEHRQEKGPSSTSSTPLELYIDASNGVGSKALAELAPLVADWLEIKQVNTHNLDHLNDKCGADFVKTNQRLPQIFAQIGNGHCCDGVDEDGQNNHDMKETVDHAVGIGDRWASLDGDADRLVFYYLTQGSDAGCGSKCDMEMAPVFHLLDGDKIAVLLASYLVELVEKAGLSEVLTCGVVQTAYANGSSTNYIRDQLKLDVVCVSTGVKHLHHRAASYDIGIYFEANGHGTVLFSSNFHKVVGQMAQDGKNVYARKLQLVSSLINQAIGDAVSDALMTDVVLRDYRWTLAEWDKMYKDLPNRLMKVNVQDRSLIRTTDAERRLESPRELQDAIDKVVSGRPGARSFVRPSGTENVVRVYAEMEGQQADADWLALKVAEMVYDLAGGVGNRPKL